MYHQLSRILGAGNYHGQQLPNFHRKVRRSSFVREWQPDFVVERDLDSNWRDHRRSSMVQERTLERGGYVQESPRRNSVRKRDRGDEMEVRNTKISRISDDGVIPSRKQQRNTQFLHAGFVTDWLETESSTGSDCEVEAVTDLTIISPGDSATTEGIVGSPIVGGLVEVEQVSEGQGSREYSLPEMPDYYQDPLRTIALIHDANWERFVDLICRGDGSSD